MIYDVIIIGGGAWGCSAAMNLSKQGVRVTSICNQKCCPTLHYIIVNSQLRYLSGLYIQRVVTPTCTY